MELNKRSSRGSTRAVRQMVVKSLVELISLVVVRKGMKATSIASMWITALAAVIRSSSSRTREDS